MLSTAPPLRHDRCAGSRDCKERVIGRLARAVFPGLPHHVTQRGNGRAQTFFCEDDYRLYRDLLSVHCRAAQVDIWSWVLMPNHVHLILVPDDSDGLRRALSQVHRAYAGHIHARLQRTGHFWQGRFGCAAMDEEHLHCAIRYVALNPVRAGLVEIAREWPWSSTRALLGEGDDGVTSIDRVRERIADLGSLLSAAENEEKTERLRRAESIGRPIGSEQFLSGLESRYGRALKARRRGRPAKEQNSALSP